MELCLDGVPSSIGLGRIRLSKGVLQEVPVDAIGSLDGARPNRP